ncbi:MAG: LysE family translocator [Pseudomonadota bacterium]
MSLEFLMTTLIVVLLPGTGVIYTIAIGLGRGFRASVAAALGCTFGIIPAALASIVGLAALLHTSAVAFVVVKYAGVAYLLYMAWSIGTDKGAFDVSADRSEKTYAKIALTGTLINVLNPKLSLFFLAFLPQFLASDAANPTRELATLALVFMVITFFVFIGYGASAAATRDFFVNRPSAMQWIKRGFAGAFAYFGVKLALAE